MLFLLPLPPSPPVGRQHSSSPLCEDDHGVALFTSFLCSSSSSFFFFSFLLFLLWSSQVRLGAVAAEEASLCVSDNTAARTQLNLCNCPVEFMAAGHARLIGCCRILLRADWSPRPSICLLQRSPAPKLKVPIHCVVLGPSSPSNPGSIHYACVCGL